MNVSKENKHNLNFKNQFHGNSTPQTNSIIRTSYSYQCHNFKVPFLIGIVACVGILYGNIGTASAAVSYDAGTNTIILESGTNTLDSIHNEMVALGYSDALSYDSGTNTYTLSASIAGKDGLDADLVLESATLIIDSDTVNEYQIKTWSDLAIRDMTIKATSTSYSWKIWSYARRTEYSVTILDSDISGGHIYICPASYQYPTTPIVIKNNFFHDYTSTNGDEGMLSLRYNAPTNAYIYNNTFNNIHLTEGQYNGILILNGYYGCVVDESHFYNCSVSSYGVIYFYGSASEDNPAIISNFEIRDCSAGINGKEFSNVAYSNGIIDNLDGRALNTYQSYGDGSSIWISDVSIDGAYIGLYHLSGKITPYLYNVRMSNMDIGIQLHDCPPVYLINSLITNYGIHKYWFLRSGGEIKEYQLADIYVKDENGNPVEFATVTIEAVSPDGSDPIINRKFESVTQTQTLSNGHTPLPNEDENKTIALLSRRVTSSTNTTYTYNITAEKNGHSNTETVIPNDNWYRTDPNTCDNTTTIVLEMGQGQDTTPPVRSNGSPSGILSSGTTSTTLSLTTNENAVCKYSTTAGVAYSSMRNTFSTTGTTSHSTTITGLSDGNTYTYHVRCIDSLSNANTDDHSITFSIDTELNGSTDPGKAGCGCTLTGEGTAPFGLVLLLLILAVISLRFRRRR